jgi:hypothetical protein
MRDSLPSTFNLEVNPTDRFSTRDVMNNSGSSDVFSNIFPLVSRVIDRFQEKRQDAEKERRERVIVEEQQLKQSELLNVSIQGLAIEQSKSVDLLKELLELVKTGSTNGNSGANGSSLTALLLGAGAAAGAAASALADRLTRRTPAPTSPRIAPAPPTPGTTPAPTSPRIAPTVPSPGTTPAPTSPRIAPTVPSPGTTPAPTSPSITTRPSAPGEPPISAGTMAGRVLNRVLSVTLIFDIENAFNQYARDAEFVPQNLKTRFNRILFSIRNNIQDHNTLLEQLERETDPTKRDDLETDIAGLVSEIQNQRMRIFEAAAQLDRYAQEDYPRRQAALGRTTTSERIVQMFPLMSILLGDPVDRTNLENIRNPTNYTEILERTLRASRMPEGTNNITPMISPLPMTPEIITPPAVPSSSSQSGDMMNALLAGFNEGSRRAPAEGGTQYAQTSTDQTVMSDAIPEPTATSTQDEPQTHAEPAQQAPAVRELNFASGVDQRINPDIASKIQQIESAFGKRLTVSSGFRDQARNARAGGARNSAHTRGNAVDLMFSGNEEDTIKLIEAASAAGIGGIGVYRAGWVHLDTESKRVWGRDFSARSIPQWARDALNTHMTGRRDGERQQPSIPEAPGMEPNAEPASGAMAEGGQGAGTTPTAMAQQQRPQSGVQVLSESQENAVAERTPTPPTVIQSQETPTGEASPGAEVGGVFQSADDPGPVEPDDAATRYARLFNMAA